MSRPPVAASSIGLRALAVTAATLIAVAGSPTAEAAEGAASNYFPGAYGNLLVAVAPEPGFLVWSQNLFYAADARRGVLQGRINTEIEVDAFYTYLNGYYVHDLPALDARLAIGGNIPFGYSALEAEVSATRSGPVSADTSRFSLGDIRFVPISLYRSFGPIHANVYQAIIAPTGQYDEGGDVNIGRNYWSFDTVGAATWFHESTGTDLSAVVGLMVNTENPGTNYRTGTEFHLDFMLNQFLTERLVVGFHGYYYDQISGDSGSGAILGSFRSDSFGLGGALFWLPAFANGRLQISGKWLHDLDATNRLEADYGIFELAFAF
jgi:hypothetical protein